MNNRLKSLRDIAELNTVESMIHHSETMISLHEEVVADASTNIEDRVMHQEEIRNRRIDIQIIRDNEGELRGIYTMHKRFEKLVENIRKRAKVLDPIRLELLLAGEALDHPGDDLYKQGEKYIKEHKAELLAIYNTVPSFNEENLPNAPGGPRGAVNDEEFKDESASSAPRPGGKR